MRRRVARVGGPFLALAAVAFLVASPGVTALPDWGGLDCLRHDPCRPLDGQDLEDYATRTVPSNALSAATRAAGQVPTPSPSVATRTATPTVATPPFPSLSTAAPGSILPSVDAGPTPMPSTRVPRTATPPPPGTGGPGVPAPSTDALGSVLATVAPSEPQVGPCASWADVGLRLSSLLTWLGLAPAPRPSPVEDCKTPADAPVPRDSATEPARVGVATVPRVDPRFPWAVAVLAASSVGALVAAAVLGRIRERDALAHPARRELVGLIAANPGLHYRELVRRAGHAGGTTRHHLRKLVEAGIVVEQAGRGYTCFFLPGRVDRSLMAASTVLKAEGSHRVLRAVLDHPGASLRQLADATRFNARTVHYHVRRMEAIRLLEVGREGRRFVTRPTATAAAALAAVTAAPGP